MITEAGSSELPFDEITRALFPLAASFSAQVDRDMTTFTGVAHRETLDRFLEVALPQLLSPGFREEDFSRLKAQHLNELTQDLRSNNEEELGKERLQELLFAGTPYGHTTLGSISGLTAITLDDVRQFVSATTPGPTWFSASPGTLRPPRETRSNRPSVHCPKASLASRTPSPATSRRGSAWRSSRRTRAQSRSHSVTPSPFVAATPTSSRCGSPAPGSVSTGHPTAASTTASGKCAG
ncbi:MAG: hypothetical protein IPI33_12530 [Dehalococcoidia bacterium]|nr:hypothetical protein [Dehalococcoidia bacterium]